MNILNNDDVPSLPGRSSINLKKQSQHIVDFLKNKQAGLILGLAFFVIVSNINQAFASESEFLDASNDEISNVVANVSVFTPLIEENAEELKTAFDGQDDGFLQKPSLDDSFKVPSHYTVEGGDTLLSIARKNGITVATILDANNLKASDIGTIKPGTNLVLPHINTSDSVAWLDEVNRIQAEKEAAARKAQEEADRKKAEASKRLALGSKRSLPYRETSTTRSSDSESYSGESTGGFAVPISHKGISRGILRGHAGIDYRADVGTPVVSGKNGRVIEVTGGWAGGFGVSVLIDHGGGLTSRYAHLSRAAVSPGQTVGQGSIIAYSGNTGFSTGPHLHFETRRGGRVVSPF